MSEPYYDHGGITIYHGDCREVLPTVAPGAVDLLLTDPPYGMAFGGFRGVQANVAADGARQGVRLVRQALWEARPAMRDDAHFLVFCHWESWPDFYDSASAYFAVKNALIWHKNRGGMGDFELEYSRDFEVILYGCVGRRRIGGRRDGAVLSGFPPVPSAKRHHPTEKPIDLLTHLVGKHSPDNGMVLDPFMGSGTTLLAASNLGRKAIGIELDERYCEIAAKRLEQGVLPL